MISIGGENLIDLVSTKNDENGLPRYIANPGGSPLNVAIAAGRQGQRTSYLTPVSEDALGCLIAERLIESSVTLAAPRVHFPTSLAVVSITEGIPSYAFHRNATAERQVSLQGLERTMATDTSLFHVGSLGLIDGNDAIAWESFFEKCHNQGIVTSLDPNVRPGLITERKKYSERIRRMMQHADIFKLSDEDLAWLYPDKTLEDALRDCRADFGDGLFILTMGGDGSLLFFEKIEVSIAAPNTNNLADTIGAGDTYMATILCWLMENGLISHSDFSKIDKTALENVGLMAAKAAAINCQRSGCNPPWREELLNI